MRVDLSADVGEGADDLPLFPLLTSVSVACGAHAGDVETMDRCVAEARRLGVSAGAHPGYPDRAGFGREAMTMTEADLTRTLIDQIRALDAVCRRREVRLAHVKPHGALYNQAAVDSSLAMTVAKAVRACGDRLALIGSADSAMLEAAATAGIPAAAEAFADRRYLADGTLAPRSHGGSMIEDPVAAAAQAVAIAGGKPIATLDGPSIHVRAETICLHSDTPGALEIARAVRVALERAGVEVAPLALR